MSSTTNEKSSEIKESKEAEELRKKYLKKIRKMPGVC